MFKCNVKLCKQLFCYERTHYATNGILSIHTRPVTVWCEAIDTRYPAYCAMKSGEAIVPASTMWVGARMSGKVSSGVRQEAPLGERS